MKEYQSKDKAEILLSFVKNKTVLDLGCVNHDVKSEQFDNWLHKRIKQSAKEVVGLDNDKKAVEYLNTKGYNLICANAENFTINKKFDVIIAADLIEHLSNAGEFLDSCRRHLKTGGILIISTPNPFSMFQFINYMTKKSYTYSDHTSWYCRQTISKLAEKNNYKVTGHIYHNWRSWYDDEKKKIVTFKLYPIYNIICKVSPKVANNQIFILKPITK